MLNQQNKQHSALFNNVNKLDRHDDYISWLDSLLAMRSERLNRRVSRLSPRRSKKGILEAVEQLLRDITTDVEEIEEVAQLLEDDL